MWSAAAAGGAGRALAEVDRRRAKELGPALVKRVVYVAASSCNRQGRAPDGFLLAIWAVVRVLVLGVRALTFGRNVRELMRS